MAKYNIQASYTTFWDATIEADSLDEARDIACNMDARDFKATGLGLGEWNIENIYEENE